MMRFKEIKRWITHQNVVFSFELIERFVFLSGFLAPNQILLGNVRGIFNIAFAEV